MSVWLSWVAATFIWRIAGLILIAIAEQQSGLGAWYTETPP